MTPNNFNVLIQEAHIWVESALAVAESDLGQQREGEQGQAFSEFVIFLRQAADAVDKIRGADMEVIVRPIAHGVGMAPIGAASAGDPTMTTIKEDHLILVSKAFARDRSLSPDAKCVLLEIASLGIGVQAVSEDAFSGRDWSAEKIQAVFEEIIASDYVRCEEDDVLVYLKVHLQGGERGNKAP